MFTAKQYARALYGLCEGKGHKEQEHAIFKFVQFLTRHHAVRLADDIIREFDDLHNEKSGRTKIEIVSARPLDHESKKELTRVGEIEERIDPSLIGGAQIKIGDTLVDGSMKSRISFMRKSLVP